MNRFLAVLGMVGPAILLAVPGGQALAPLVPLIIHAVGEAEKVPGAKGDEKKARVMSVVDDAIATTNQAAGKTIVDPTLARDAASKGVDAVVASTKLVQSLHPAA